MKNSITGLVCGLSLVSLAVAADVPRVNDGYGHGDPPFLQESGWVPFGGVPPKVRAERPAGQWQS